MKRTLIATSLAFACNAAWATPVFHQPGANLTYGSVSNTQSLTSYVGNPATAASAFYRGEGGEFRIGILSSLGFTLELGGVDGFKERIDELQGELDRQITQEQLGPLKSKFDVILQDMGDQPYLMNMGFSGHLPGFPLVVSKASWGGSYVFDVNLALETKLKFLDSPLGFNPETQKPETNSAIYAKAAAVSQASLGYSHDLFKTDYGTAYAGIRASYYYLGLHKSVIGFALAKDLKEVLDKEGKKQLKPATGVGADLGFIWASRNYRLGATFANLNEPSFAYDEIGQNCESLLAGPERNSCLIAVSYATDIALREMYVMSRQAKLEGAIYTNSQNWVVAMNYDTNAVNDPVGKSFGIFIQDDAYGEAGKGGVNKALHKRNLALVGEGRYKRNSDDVGAGLAALKTASPEVVIMVGAYKACAAFIKEAHASGFSPKFANLSFVGTSDFIKEAGKDGEGVYIL